MKWESQKSCAHIFALLLAQQCFDSESDPLLVSNAAACLLAATSVLAKTQRCSLLATFVAAEPLSCFP